MTGLELARQMLDDPEDPEYTEGVVATLEMLDANRQIHTARLGENRLGPAHAAVLAPALNGGSGLSRLLVDGNQFGAEGASALAAAIGSATMKTSFAPAPSAESRTARFSTSVIPEGTQTMTLGFTLKK